MARDLDLFGKAMAGVTPLRRDDSRKGLMPRANAERPSKKKRQEPSPSTSPRAGPLPGPQPFDRDVDRALSRGKRLPEAKLDLHGLTLVAAERAVTRFLAQSAAEGHRVVLIVTGKGLRLDGGRILGGRIRAEFPGWLERADNRALVAGVKSAHPRHGGGGAYYVLLRRR
jgi:DNA-nicking Smr family endonuclease